MVGQRLWSVRMEGWKAVQFSFLLKRGKITSAFFKRCHNRRQPFWHSSILSLLTSDRKKKLSIRTKKEKQDSGQLKTMSEIPAILLEDFLNCIFIYDQNLGFCVSYILFGGSCAVWDPVGSSGFFTTIYLPWSCPLTDTFLWTSLSFAKHTVLSLSTITANLNSVWEIKQYIQQSDTTKRQTRWVIVTTVFSMSIGKKKQQEKKVLLKLKCVM